MIINKILIIRLAGGLGNQIFQLAAGLLLAKQHNIKTIQLDDHALSTYSVQRESVLMNFFNISNFDGEIFFKRSRLTQFRIPRIIPIKFYKFAFIGDKNFQKMLTSYNNAVFFYLDGYFQKSLNQMNLETETDILRSLLKYEYKSKAGCIIHVRGGDFIKLGWNKIASDKYYEKAIHWMITRYDQRDFSIVTDDKAYVKKIFTKINIPYKIIGGSMEEDFKLIGEYHYRILSSSTFAFWASLLGINKTSIVIAPRFWSPNNQRNLLLENEVDINDKF